MRGEILTGAGCLFIGFVCGLNTGYEMGSDTMECVMIATISPDNEQLVDEACFGAQHWLRSPAYWIRVNWLKVTGDAVGGAGK